jgi:hypothetical protein
VSVDPIRQPTGGWRVAKKQVWNLAELSLFFGYADTVSVDPNLHVVAHPKVGEKQLGSSEDLEILRGISKKGSQNLPRLSIQNASCYLP